MAQINVYLKSGSHDSHEVPNVNLFYFRFLLVDFGKMLCSSANELLSGKRPKRGRAWRNGCQFHRLDKKRLFESGRLLDRFTVSHETEKG